MIQDIPGLLTVASVAASAARTTTLTGTGVDLQSYEGNVGVILNSSAATAGTSPTLDVKIQDSADNSSFADVSGLTFTQVTTTASVQLVRVPKSVRRYIRAIGTIGGTSSPAFTYGLELVGVRKTI
jgi:hypothetical protein